MSVADDIADSQTRHTVYLLRWATSTYNKHSILLDKLEADLSAKLAMRAPEDGSFTAARLQMMLNEVEKKSNELFKALNSAVNGDFKELAAYESSFHVKSISNAYPIEMSLATVTPAAVHAAAMSQPFQGKVLKDWWKGQNAATKDAYNRALRTGFAQGETISQMARRVGDVGQKTRRDVDAIIRTATSHMSQVALTKVALANEDLFKGEEFVATLDGRTTMQCAANDGKTFPFGKGPQIPLHFGERSRRIPATKSWRELGFTLDDDKPLSSRRYIADKRRFKDIPKEDRDKLVGRTTARSYNEWLRTQPRSFVEDTLGKAKAKLYLDGDLPLDKFVDRRNNPLTLEELARRESAAFTKAGID